MFFNIYKILFRYSLYYLLKFDFYFLRVKYLRGRIRLVLRVELVSFK